jgi:hypothetical protein
MKRSSIYRILRYFAPKSAKRLYHSMRGAINRRKSSAEVFSSIYETNQWGEEGGFNSGAGTLDPNVSAPYLRAVQAALKEQGLSNSRFVDLGCGDFRIGSHVARLSSSYIGGDVVPGLVEYLNQQYGSECVHFTCVDIVHDELPDGDVCFIRQVFQHLSNEQIQLILPKLARYRCVFITEHIPNRFKPHQPNLDKAQGPDIRLYWNSGVFLDQPPFSLPASSLTEILTVEGTPVWEGQDYGEIVTWIYLPPIE